MTLGGLAGLTASRLGSFAARDAAMRTADPLVAAMREGDDVTIQVTRPYGDAQYFSGHVVEAKPAYVWIKGRRGGNYALHHAAGAWAMSNNGARVGDVTGVVNRSQASGGGMGAFDGVPAGYRVVSVGFAVDIYKGSTYVARAQLGGMMHGQRLIDYFPRGSYKLFKRDGDVNLPRSIFPEIKRLLGYEAVGNTPAIGGLGAASGGSADRLAAEIRQADYLIDRVDTMWGWDEGDRADDAPGLIDELNAARSRLIDAARAAGRSMDQDVRTEIAAIDSAIREAERWESE